MTGTALLSDVLAKKVPKEDSERDEKDFLALLAIFRRLLSSQSDDERLALTEELMAQRADNVIRRAIEGFGMSYDEAIALIQNQGELSSLDAEKRKILIAAIDNLIDFAVAEEYQMLSDLPDDYDAWEESEEIIRVFKTFNQRYAKIEDSDAEYAMIVAAGLVSIKPTAILTYMTMQDERVRPWHRVYEGFSAPKSSFPAWLIPPIEHQCRCFLIEDEVYGAMEVQASRESGAIPQMPDWFNLTFKECVAFGGRIFSDEHPYFKIGEEHSKQLQVIADNIKSRYFHGEGRS